MERTKKFVINTVVMAIYQAVLMVYGFIVPWIILKYYGSEINGLVSSLNQFITYFSLVEAGISGAAVFALYKPLASGDKNEISGIVSATKKYYYKAGYLFSGLVIVLSILYPFIRPVDGMPQIVLSMLVLFLGAKGFFDFFTLAKYRVLLTADQKSYVISLASILYQVTNVIILFILASHKLNISFVYGVSISALLIRTIFLRCYVKRNYSYIDYNAKAFDAKLDKRWDALIQQILGIVQNGAPIIIITFTTNYVWVSIFSVYNMVYQGINGILGIFTAGLGASFGDVIAREEKEVLKKSYLEFLFGYEFLNVFFYSVVTVMLAPFASIYTKNVATENYYLPYLGMLFGLCGFLYNLKTPQGMLIISAGHYKETKLQCFIQALIIIVLGIPMSMKFSIYGVLLALLISNIYRCIDVFLYVPRYIVGGCLKETLRTAYVSIFQYIVCVFLGVLVTQGITKYTISNWIYYAAVVSLITFIIMLFFSMCFFRRTMLDTIRRMKLVFFK